MFPTAVEPIFRYAAHIPAQILVVLTLVAFVLGFRVRSWWAWTVTAIGLVTFGVGLLVRYPPPGGDLHYYWVAGCDVWAGIDPYQSPAIVYPPTALPLFALFALLPFSVVLPLWTALNGLGLVVLVFAAHRCLSSCAGSEAWRLPAPMVAVAAAALTLAVSTQFGLSMGQVSVFMALGLIVALQGRVSGRPAMVGVGMASASIKAATMVPFLLLFLRKRDRISWLWMAGIGCMLALVFTSLGDLPHRIGEGLANINIQGQPGGMNCPLDHGNIHQIGFDRAFFCLGVTDLKALWALQLIVVLVVTGWIAWRVAGPNALDDAAAFSFVALGSMLFLYHRIHDLVILIVPLLYTIGRSRILTGQLRWWYTGCAAAILGVLYFRFDTVQTFSTHPPFGGALGYMLTVLIVPYPVWALLAAMFLLDGAERQLGRRRKSLDLEAKSAPSVLCLLRDQRPDHRSTNEGATDHLPATVSRTVRPTAC